MQAGLHASCSVAYLRDGDLPIDEGRGPVIVLVHVLIMSIMLGASFDPIPLHGLIETGRFAHDRQFRPVMAAFVI
jgi:hypothetical protein